MALLSVTALPMSFPVDPPSYAPVIGAVGDMACDPADSRYHEGQDTSLACAQSRTSDAMVSDTSLTTVLGLGDYQYDCGDPSDYEVSYDPTWGRLDESMNPVVGNHEYKTGTDVFGTPCPYSNATAQSYFAHFGESAHPASAGHYSYDIGTWHLIAMNGNCAKKSVGGCSASSLETAWLKADLAATNQPCVLAYWHQPLFTGLAIAGGQNSLYKPWWDALYAAHADVVLNGHIHDYQRFAALDPSGNLDPVNGITQYVVGTGGEEQVAVKASATPQPLAWFKTFGYLRMTLEPTGWTTEFVDFHSTVLDTYSGTCHL